MGRAPSTVQGESNSEGSSCGEERCRPSILVPDVLQVRFKEETCDSVPLFRTPFFLSGRFQEGTAVSRTEVTLFI